MRGRFWTRANRTALAISLLLALITIGTLADLKASDWAAWVQAVGSIGAIVGAAAGLAWQMDRQHTMVLEHEARAEERTLKEHLAFFNFVLGQMSSLRSAAAQKGSFEDLRWELDVHREKRFLEPSLQVLAAQELHKVPGILTRYDLTQARMQLQEFYAAIQQCNAAIIDAGAHFKPSDARFAADRLAEIGDAFERSVNRFMEHMDREDGL